MAKFCGMIGFVKQHETRPGVWTEEATERKYRGDIVRNIRQSETAGVNDNVRISNVLEIVANPYIRDNLSCIRYVKWMGVNWKVTSVEVRQPRLVLTLGEVYNGKTA